MKRKPTPTKRERQKVAADEALGRLVRVVDRLRVELESAPDTNTALSRTPFEQAARKLLSVYAGASSHEVADAALAVLEMADAQPSVTCEDIVESLAGICVDEGRRAALAESLDETLVRRMRLILTRPTTSPTIQERSALFDASLVRITTEAP